MVACLTNSTDELKRVLSEEPDVALAWKNVAERLIKVRARAFASLCSYFMT